MTNSIRVQVYYKDMGLFRKSHIQHMSREEFDKTNKSQYQRAIELTPANWYGENLPEVLRGLN
jgi:hypothetical protein